MPENGIKGNILINLPKKTKAVTNGYAIVVKQTFLIVILLITIQ